MGSSKGGAIGCADGVCRKGQKTRRWLWVFLLDDVLLFGATDRRRARAAAGVRVQQGVNSVVLERMTQFGVKWQGCGELGTRASGDAWVVLHSHGL